jgi:putative ABC transport system substrate-binding protein
MKRRDFIALVGGAAAWPLAANAQTAPGTPPRPVIGFLNNLAQEQWPPAMAGFRRGLGQAGYAEGENVAFTFRWSEGRSDRLPELAADLASANVSVIVSSADTLTALAARAAAPNIPVVFMTQADPVRFGLVATLDQPGGNATGMYLTKTVVDVANRTELWRLLVPDAKVYHRIEIFDTDSVAAKTDPQAAFAFNFDPARRSNPHVVIPPAKAIIIDCGPFLDQRRRHELVSLAASHGVPTMYDWRVFAEEGGLISYGIDIANSYAQIGRTTGEILKGRSPAELPVQKPGKFETVINLKTATALGLAVPPELRARADTVIE